MIIIGAGMAGCLAGVMNPSAKIYEASPTLPTNHDAVLRFREDKISKATGIEFRKVKVRKAIWDDGERLPSPRLLNLYSRKVTGKIIERSIGNLDTIERYIAPSNFHHVLADFCRGRIEFGVKADSIDNCKIKASGTQVLRENIPVISTVPMPILCKLISIKHKEKFVHQPINVSRYKVNGADVFQTIYYPSQNNSIYRATLTGDDLIVESVSSGEYMIDAVYHSLGISAMDCTLYKQSEQQYGKIAPINEVARKGIILEATMKANVYSLGRFACWRNILLDDVYDDIFRVRNMIRGHKYDTMLNGMTT